MSGKGRRRRGEDDNEDEEPTRNSGSKRRKVSAPDPGDKQPPKKETLSAHRLKKTQLPDGARSLMDAYYELIRLLWGLAKATDVPTLPPADVLAQFNERYKDGQNPLTAPTSAAVSLSLTQTNFLNSLQAASAQPHTATRTERSLSKLDDYVLQNATAECQRYGLMSWRPDFRSSPESPYNMVHRIIAETLFRGLAASHAFAHKRINLDFLRDTAANRDLLRRTFNHFVFHVHRSKWTKELLKPGSNVQTASDSAMFNRRTRLQESRMDQLEAAPRRHRRTLEDPAQLSCDERAKVTVDYEVSPGTSATREADAFLVYNMPLRSAKYTRWYEHLDEAAKLTRELTKKRAGGFAATQPKLERIRRDDAPDTKVPKLPSKTPIDWFDKDDFNALPAAVRRRYADHPRVAFPLDERLMYQNPPHESMTMKEKPFMEKYGNAVLALYRIPGYNEPDVASDDPDADTSDSSDNDPPPPPPNPEAPPPEQPMDTGS